MPGCGVVGVELEKFRLCEFELLRDQVARKLVDLGVHFAHAAIVIASRCLDLFFDLGEIVLQAQKILVRLNSPLTKLALDTSGLV